MGLATTKLLSTAMMLTSTSAWGDFSPTLPGSFSIRWLTTLVAAGGWEVSFPLLLLVSWNVSPSFWSHQRPAQKGE